ncbi:MAG: leucine-rich repeat domain-containing protein, partial [Chlamydiia bacterium]|nr:leucine-rich repeat domain-containing protein [Chlamydiia bacterium]
SLTKLNLSNSQIESYSGNVFDKLSSLELLDLSNNRFMPISLYFLEKKRHTIKYS